MSKTAVVINQVKLDSIKIKLQDPLYIANAIDKIAAALTDKLIAYY